MTGQSNRGMRKTRVQKETVGLIGNSLIHREFVNQVEVKASDFSSSSIFVQRELIGAAR